jgi:hypothetical protein
MEEKSQSSWLELTSEWGQIIFNSGGDNGKRKLISRETIPIYDHYYSLFPSDVFLLLARAGKIL